MIAAEQEVKQRVGIIGAIRIASTATLLVRITALSSPRPQSADTSNSLSDSFVTKLVSWHRWLVVVAAVTTSRQLPRSANRLSANVISY